MYTISVELKECGVDRYSAFRKTYGYLWSYDLDVPVWCHSCCGRTRLSLLGDIALIDALYRRDWALRVCIVTSNTNCASSVQV